MQIVSVMLFIIVIFLHRLIVLLFNRYIIELVGRDVVVIVSVISILSEQPLFLLYELFVVYYAPDIALEFSIIFVSFRTC